MTKPLFRETALQNLSSPEQLDQIVRLTRPSAWLAMGALGLVLVVVVLWSIFGSLPTNITGQGIIISHGGTYDIVAPSGGVITDFENLETGDRVRKGQVLGHLEQPMLAFHRDAAQRELERLEKENADTPDGLASQGQGRTRASALKKNEGARQVQASLLAARHRLAELTIQHALASTIVSPRNGTVIEVLASEGVFIAASHPVLSVEEEGSALEALIYLPPQGEAKLIKPGMAVQLSPSTARKERYGYLIGRVTAVSKFPSTEHGMLAMFNNPALVRELLRQGPPVAITVALTPAPQTRSGYQWSSPAAEQLELNSGTIASASITIEKQRPISLLIPLLRQTAGF